MLHLPFFENLRERAAWVEADVLGNLGGETIGRERKRSAAAGDQSIPYDRCGVGGSQ